MVKALIFSILLTLSLSASAVNYLTFGGGNYVYAEQGNLYFNLDTYAFDNRKWSYDGENFTSNINIKMNLKTKYTNDWYDEVLANKKSEGLMYANYIKQPFNYQNKGGYQKVVIPAIAWGIVGAVARSAAWSAFRGFVSKNAAKHAVMGGALAYFLDLARTDGVNCDEVDCRKTYEYTYISKPETVNSDVLKKDLYATSSEISDKNLLVSRVQANISTTNKWGGTLSSCKIESATSNTVACYYKRSGGITDGYSFGFNKLPAPVTIEQLLTDPELIPYFDKTCKLFSSECVNEPTDGKNIGNVQLTAGVINGSGVSVTGPPYTNPITGDAQQDKVIIGGTSSGIGVNSATNTSWQYTPTMGQSITTNTVDVITTARPDLTNTGTADVAKPNSQTGTKPDVIVPPVTVPEFTDINDMIDFCKANPNALSCVEAKEEEVKDTDIEIPETQQGLNFNPANIFANNGVCPAPVAVAFMTETLEFKYDQFCTLLEYLRGIIIAVCAIMALRILMKEA